MKCNFTLNYWLSLVIFASHIILNFIIAKPNPTLEEMLKKYTFSPPFWVFGIWFVIWTLQGIMFYKTHHSQFWNNQLTILFILVCAGNIGSQIAGAYNLSGFLYISCIFCMLVCSILFMQFANTFSGLFPIVKSASQLYVGWASLAFVVGLGAILVADFEVITNGNYSTIGYILLIIIPLIIWLLWVKQISDYRIVSIPYFLVIFSFILRQIFRLYF